MHLFFYTYTYHNADCLLSIVSKKSNGDTITSQTFTLDDNGNRETDVRIQPQAPMLMSESLTYQYNIERNRLTGMDDGASNISLAYDNEYPDYRGNKAPIGYFEKEVFHRRAYQCEDSYC